MSFLIPVAGSIVLAEGGDTRDRDEEFPSRAVL